MCGNGGNPEEASNGCGRHGSVFRLVLCATYKLRCTAGAQRRPWRCSLMDRHCCRVALHPRRTEIDAMLVAGTSPLKIGADFGIPKSIVYRHRDKHLPKALVKAQAAAEVAQADDL